MPKGANASRTTVLVSEPDANGKYSIQFLSFASGKTKTVAPISGFPGEGLSASLDGWAILFTLPEKNPAAT
jgi:hypothetical protein